MKLDEKAIKVCSFFGHRKIDITKELKEKIKNTIEYLIINYNVKVFMFGSKSEFNDVCHLIVDLLKVKYPFIKRIAYTCKSEGCIFESERKKWEEIYEKTLKNKELILCVDEEFEFESKFTSGKASYIKRNQAMIDDSDFCVFYYDNTYMVYKANSGTKIAYEYALKKNKKIINLK